jgi:hypothetical protein
MDTGAGGGCVKMIKVNRAQMVLKKMDNNEDNYMNASFARRVSFIWELTQEIWSLKDKKNAKRRLQRHITAFIKR